MIPFRPSYPWYLFALIVTTVLAIAVSIYCLNAGRFIVFQNLFYFPIIIACVYYLRKGFVFSVLLAFFYLLLIFAYTSNSTIIYNAFIRVAIFIMVAVVVLFLSQKQKRAEEGENRVQSWQEGINRILGLVLEAVPFDEKLKYITDGVVEIFGADFCRIWIIEKGDLCSAGCMHAEAIEGPHVCRDRDKCLYLKASSGRYTHIDGKIHRRVPFGAYKIGRIASGEEIRFLTNDVQRDPRVHDHEWAKSLGLEAFAGYRLRPTDGETLGVLALFAKFEISPEMDTALEGLSRAISLVIQKDIVERALTESKEALIRIQKAVESSGDAIGMANAQGSHFYQNRAFLDLFEYSVAELNKPLAPVVVYADPEVGREVFANIMQGNPWVGETIMVAKSGRRFPVFLRADAIKDENGNIIGLIGIHTEITERKLAEEKLNNQMSFISALLDTIPSPIFYKDTAGKYLGCNRAYVEIMGKSREEVVGKDVYNLYPPEIADLYVKKDRELYEHPGNQIYDGKFSAADGTVRDVIISKATYTDTSKNIAGVVGIFIDITDRKHAAEALEEERRRLQQSLDEVRTLRGIVPICANCKKIRDDKGYWNQVEKYVSEHTDAEFSHGICPDCAKKLYPDIYEEQKIRDMERLVILLVDDEEEFRRMFIRQIKRILKDHEFEFIEASDGEEALELLKGGAKPSIIILDSAMPKINGVELLRRIDSDHNGLYDVPRIMISGYSQKELISEAQRLRCVFFEKSTDNTFYQQICQHMTNKLVFLAHKNGGRG
ncbi:MAG: PAS domain S-box protein [Syntrophales bacterium]